jgi:hypothetical protein
MAPSFFDVFLTVFGFFAFFGVLLFGLLKVIEFEWNYRSGLKDELRAIRSGIDELKTRTSDQETQSGAK